MDQNPKEPTFEDSLKQVMQTLPPVIRTYLAQGKYTAVAKSLMAKYNLRIDQGGILEREIMLLLMGVEDPNEFTQALVEEAKLDQQTVSGIVQDINEQIFIPLRAEEEKKGGVAQQSAVPQATPDFSRESVAPQKSSDNFNAENKPPLPRQASPDIAPLPPKIALPRTAALPVSGLADASRLLEDHEELHLEINRLSVRVSPPPPPNLPGAPLPQPATPYSADPYREPIDEM